MSAARWYRVFRLDFLYSFRRPLFWILILVLGFTSYGLSSGTLQIATGDSRVGGTKAWVTSEFAVGEMMIIVVFLWYGFFLAVAAGMPLAIQLVARPGEDAALLRVAAAFEQARPWAQVRPEIEEL